MDFEDVISKYLQTLIRKNIVNIDNNKFLKKPYLENYMIKLFFFIYYFLLVALPFRQIILPCGHKK